MISWILANSEKTIPGIVVRPCFSCACKSFSFFQAADFTGSWYWAPGLQGVLIGTPVVLQSCLREFARSRRTAAQPQRYKRGAQAWRTQAAAGSCPAHQGTTRAPRLDTCSWAAHWETPCTQRLRKSSRRTAANSSRSSLKMLPCRQTKKNVRPCAFLRAAELSCSASALAAAVLTSPLHQAIEPT